MPKFKCKRLLDNILHPTDIKQHQCVINLLNHLIVYSIYIHNANMFSDVKYMFVYDIHTYILTVAWNIICSWNMGCCKIHALQEHMEYSVFFIYTFLEHGGGTTRLEPELVKQHSDDRDIIPFDKLLCEHVRTHLHTALKSALPLSCFCFVSVCSCQWQSSFWPVKNDYPASRSD